MTRPKGYAAWNPRPETLAVIEDVKAVLEEYRDHLPLTVRQIFYRLVGQYGYEKTERAYARLCEYLVRARRAQMMSFEQIRDDGTIAWYVLSLSLARWGEAGGGFAGPAHYARSVRSLAANYQRDRLGGQPVAIELWCEAAGMVPQLDLVARDFSVPVYSTGGFSSVTVTYEIAQRALGRDIPTVFLHVGDFDPSGESIFEAMGVDAKSFLRGRMMSDRRFDHLPFVADLAEELGPDVPDLVLKRVALTADQVEEHDLPTAPPKASDTRSVNWSGDTCQAEALPPDLLADIVRGAVESELDQEALDDLLEVEKRERTELVAYLQDFDPPGAS